MDAMGLLTDTRERMSQHTVFGEPITHEGIVVIPVARIGGMAGAGTGNRSDTGTSEGAGKSEGAGFSMRAAPVGVFVIRNGTVRWRPAVNINKIIFGGQVVAIVALLTVRSIVKATRCRRGLSGRTAGGTEAPAEQSARP
jgi:uncharacterized spore protein YtfJ